MSTAETFSPAELDLIKRVIAPRAAELVAAGRHPALAVVDAAREARDAFAKMDREKLATLDVVGRSVWIAARATA